ncbi:major histocompatibility complex class I-related gene protein [Coregonus clupeaformis]|uniref:major histocompatibility complex class I-related gene protein n=1 Tax=Coregonus clupeaformis TaxID=59861 RepID=UPI001BE0E3D8|nr:major histocompatibility complex class I-related gene protein [Coregonus clupeaformis]
MKMYLILLFGIHGALAVTHSLRYFNAASSGILNVPEFVEMGMVNDQVISHYDSITKIKVPKQSWMKEYFNKQYWDSTTENLRYAEEVSKVNIQTAQMRFNQTGGMHFNQDMYGCVWDDETGFTDGFHHIGYDGIDLLAFDLKTETWIAAVPQAFNSKLKWESNPSNIEREKLYLTQECIEWLKKYLDYGKTTLQRTVPPSVSLLQKTPSSPVTCHATGFYPSGVMVFWQKDGQDHHEDVKYGEILHNDDGTFQKRTHLTVTPEEWKNNNYQCVVQVAGIKEHFIKVLTESEIQTNWGANDPNTTGSALIIGVVVALLAIVAVVVGVFIWKKNKNKKGFHPTSTSDTDSDNSGKGVQKT